MGLQDEILRTLLNALLELGTEAIKPLVDDLAQWIADSIGVESPPEVTSRVVSDHPFNVYAVDMPKGALSSLVVWLEELDVSVMHEIWINRRGPFRFKDETERAGFICLIRLAMQSAQH